MHSLGTEHHVTHTVPGQMWALKTSQLESRASLLLRTQATLQKTPVLTKLEQSWVEMKILLSHINLTEYNSNSSLINVKNYTYSL